MINTLAGIDIRVEYFALFKACTKKMEEAIHLDSSDANDLYSLLTTKYRFPIPKDRIHLEVNDEYSPWETPLKQGDRVVFIPTVSGG